MKRLWANHKLFIVLLLASIPVGIIYAIDSNDEVRLLCISDKTYRKNVNSVGDIVGIFPSTHKFSPDEKIMFDIVIVDGTKAEIKRKFRNVKPTKGEEDKYHFNTIMMGGSKWQSND